ncbi:hypothetical protein GQX74_009646 [Glossina fuscipes]|nr:hypothetical protein GQX74_009646 [Glossina fuscipes]
MEGANLRGCNFEDPSCLKSNLKGINLKGACLESSNMANMKNCNLQTSVLADLERCNLWSSDFQEARLRGAHLQVVKLTLKNTPLHMSHAIR